MSEKRKNRTHHLLHPAHCPLPPFPRLTILHPISRSLDQHRVQYNHILPRPPRSWELLVERVEDLLGFLADVFVDAGGFFFGEVESGVGAGEEGGRLEWDDW